MTTNSSAEKTKQLLRRLISEFTYHPEALRIVSEPIGRMGKITLQAHKADTSRIVGERGSHIKALTAIVEAIGDKEGQPLIVELIEPVFGEPERFAKYKGAENWNGEKIRQLLQDVAAAIFRPEPKIETHSAGETTAMEILVQQRSQSHRVDDLEIALRALFNAIGKANGRKLHVSILPVPALKEETK